MIQDIGNSSDSLKRWNDVRRNGRNVDGNVKRGLVKSRIVRYANLGTKSTKVPTWGKMAEIRTTRLQDSVLTLL